MNIVSKKLLIVVVTLFLASANNAEGDVLIGSWENQTNEGWRDYPLFGANNWVGGYIDDPLVMPSRYEYSDDWSTDGDYSLKANVTGWDMFQSIDVHNEFFKNSALEFDIYWVPQEGSSATWAQVERIDLNTETNPMTDMEDSQFTIGMDETIHCFYWYNYRYALPEYASPTDTFVNFIWAFNADAPVYIYIDNVMLTNVPEPATLALLGFGGLVILRRRK
jgi:hypothetical protein